MTNDEVLESLKGKKLFVGTPMYGGQCTGMYTKSIADLCMAATKVGLPIRLYYLFNESLITRARNYVVDEFLRSDATHLLFIDSDIGFSYKDVMVLMHLTGNPEEDPTKKDIVTGPYPKKTIAWEKVHKAAKLGYGDENPFNLSQFAGDFVFNVAPEIESYRIDAPVEVMEGGTGFMMISRHVFEKYAEAHPELSYRPDHVRTENFDGEREIMAYFDTVIDPKTRRYLSEDYMFSRNCRELGLKVWMCPWMRLSHVGTHTFDGSIAAMATIQASPTADNSSKQKTYQKGK